jgi:hypothetical protein
MLAGVCCIQSGTAPVFLLAGFSYRSKLRAASSSLINTPVLLFAEPQQTVPFYTRRHSLFEFPLYLREFPLYLREFPLYLRGVVPPLTRALANLKTCTTYV